MKYRLSAYAPGLTPRAVLEKLATIRMLDVILPTTDGRHPIMPRHTEPDPDRPQKNRLIEFLARSAT